MTRTLLAVVTGAALSVSAAVPAPDSLSRSPVDSELRTAAAVHEPAIDIDLAPRPLPDQVLARTVGTGPTSDFLCGAATGAGFALTLSGVGTVAGVLLGGAGMACAMFF